MCVWVGGIVLRKTKAHRVTRGQVQTQEETGQKEEEERLSDDWIRLGIMAGRGR